jgi:hypothetical protein
MRHIGDREDLRNRLEREKMSAEEELATLNKKENELFVKARRKELEEMVRKREEMAREEEQLQKEIRNFEKEQKQEKQERNLQLDEDFAFREGREAGKLAMQRRLLEEKKREIEHSLKLKRREEEKMHKELDNINDRPIFIPEFRAPNGPPRHARTEPQP